MVQDRDDVGSSDRFIDKLLDCGETCGIATLKFINLLERLRMECHSMVLLSDLSIVSCRRPIDSTVRR
jgi:hypothetical protein